MKSKKKVGLVKRIAVGVCAVMFAFFSLGVSKVYFADETYTDIYYRGDYPGLESLTFPDGVFEAYEHVVVLITSSGSYSLVYDNNPLVLEADSLSGCYVNLSKSCSGYKSTYDFGSSWSDQKYSLSIMGIPTDSSTPSIVGGHVLFFKGQMCDSDGNVLYENNGLPPSLPSDEVYSSSLGYLQDIKRQFIYLEDDAFDLVEDTAACKFTFANNTTTGLDITDGNWSIRHYMQIEVKNAKKEYETVDVYDKVFLNEYAAADGKIIYQQKDTVQRLHEESGFDGLSWWESNFLGYITYYNDYFQLVRTNEDGSVEYGGYVKVWQDEYNINHSTTLGEDESQDDSGYNDNIVSGSHGSGGTYEEAEKDADENAANSSSSSGELSDQLNDIVSTITAVPEIFARMFSFLPDWCLNLFGASVALAGGVLLWKALRG